MYEARGAFLGEGPLNGDIYQRSSISYDIHIFRLDGDMNWFL